MNAKDHSEWTQRTDRNQALPPAKDQWAVETPYLKQLKATHRVRACEAMRWRPLFLQALAAAGGYMFALKAAGVCYNTFRAHERNDPEFAVQVREAEAEGAQLLHDVCWRRVTEGDLEAIYWQGQIVGHIRKFDTRLQIEFLRCYMPERFKRPGAQVNVGVKSDVFVLTEEQRHELQRIHKESLLSHPIQKDDDPDQHNLCSNNAKNSGNENPGNVNHAGDQKTWPATAVSRV